MFAAKQKCRAGLFLKACFECAGGYLPVPTIRLSMQPEQGMKMRVGVRG